MNDLAADGSNSGVAVTFNISGDSLDLALATVKARGSTDIFPVPFEYQAIRHQWADVKDELSRTDLDTYAVRPHRHSLSPKRALGFRFATEIDPIDHLLATALVIEMAPALEATRVPVGAGRVHSYRFDPALLETESLLYSYDLNFTTFHNASVAAAEHQGGWVVTTDIADFYGRLYLHPIETALGPLAAIRDQARVFIKMLKAWNQRVSYGVPVGPGFSRLIAEATIADIDQLLLAEGINFFRYSDDYRLIVDSKREGHRVLSLLAEALRGSHGLTLNEAKTEILTIEDFKNRWAERGDRPTVRDLRTELEAITGWSLDATLYNDQLGENELPQEVLEALDRLDLPELIRHELEERTPEPQEPDYPVLSFALGQMAASHHDCLDVLERQAHRLYPIARRLAQYLDRVGTSIAFDEGNRETGRKIVAMLLHDPAAASTPFLRAWWLEAARALRLPIDEIATQHNDHPDDFTRPSALIAAAESGGTAWLRPKKRDLSACTAWTRRSLIGALSTLPDDEYSAWVKANERSFDSLERAVATWARTTRPFA